MTTYQKNNSLTEKRLGNELFLHNDSGDQLLVLNTTSMLIWSLCDGTHTLEQMLDVFIDLLPDVPSRELEKDIHEQLEEWVRGEYILTATLR